MKKEYRAELRQLAAAERKLLRDWKAFNRNIQKQMAALKRSDQRGWKATDREITRIANRRAILQGRLAS